MAPTEPATGPTRPAWRFATSKLHKREHSNGNAALLEFAKALGSRDNALRRDECGDWAIFGSRGHIFACPDSTPAKPDPQRPSFQIMVSGVSARGWSFAKAAMTFAIVCQDGDDEGALMMPRLPTKDEAEIIRDKLGIAKRREDTEAALERLRGMAVKHHFSRPDARDDQGRHQ